MRARLQRETESANLKQAHVSTYRGLSLSLLLPLDCIGATVFETLAGTSFSHVTSTPQAHFSPALPLALLLCFPGLSISRSCFSLQSFFRSPAFPPSVEGIEPRDLSINAEFCILEPAWFLRVFVLLILKTFLNF